MITLDTPIQIGTFQIKNRITMAPTVKFDYTDASGLATKKHVKHYGDRAKGGTGLICVEAVAVTPDGRFWTNHMGLWNREQMESQKEVAEAIHAGGAVAIIQINHTGFSSNPELGAPIGPSAILKTDREGKEYTTVEMSIDEIHAMQQKFIDAALLAKEAGYDGVQLHGCHGYLINQFMSPLTNKREDAYGKTVEGFARFGAEIIAGIREACGEEFLLSIRTSGYETSSEHAIAVADEYVKAGCDYLQVSVGIDSLDDVPDDPDEKVNKMRALGVRFHKFFQGKVPVSCIGGIFTAEDAKYLVEQELVDTVDVARGLLADPEFADAAINGGPYQKCLDCRGGCQYGPFMKHQCPAKILRNK